MRASPLCALLLLLSSPVSVTSIDDVTSLQIEAEAARAALLSPQSYLRGSEALQQARDEAPGEARQGDLVQATEAFETALANAATARAQLSQPLAARDARRILVVSPGSLTEQWQDELLEKFGLVFAQTLAGRPGVRSAGTGTCPAPRGDVLVPLR